MLLRITSAIAIAAALSGCAYAGEPLGPQILSELPANAPAGECYARVRVPGTAVQGPPQVTGAHWEMTPGPPGAPGPIWCLIPTTSQAVSWTPDRYGFVRVVCQDQLTGARVAGIQRELYSRGYYRGSFTGEYDAATTQGIAAFQQSAGIADGGYLSIQTMQALEAGGGYYAQQGYAQPVQAPFQGYAGASAYASASAYSSGGGYGGGYPCMSGCAMPAPPPPPPPPVVQPCAPCGWVQAPPPPPACPQACGGVSYGPVAGYGQSYGGAYGSSYGQAYYSQSYGGQGYQYGYGGVGFSPVPAYAAASAAASASARAGYGYAGVSASARASASAVQGGYLTWSGRGY